METTFGNYLTFNEQFDSIHCLINFLEPNFNFVNKHLPLSLPLIDEMDARH